jgi:predicted O-methyltransferase YrrM
MSCNVEYGNVTEDEARRIAGVNYDWEDHEPGATEPWVTDLACAFVRAIGAKCVLETGSFIGLTSLALLKTLEALGGGDLICGEIDRDRASIARTRLACWQTMVRGKARFDVVEGDVLDLIKMLPDSSVDAVWLDDNHEKPHVRREIQMLWPKVRVGGLILLHDVYGVCDLWTVVEEFGGYSVQMPRMGPAGSIGIIQVRE